MDYQEYRRALERMPQPGDLVIFPRWVPKDAENRAQIHAEKADKLMWRAWTRYENKVDFDNREASNDLYMEYLHRRDVALALAHETGYLISVPD